MEGTWFPNFWMILKAMILAVYRRAILGCNNAETLKKLRLLASGFHVPLITEGGFSFGQYGRSMRMNLAFGANDNNEIRD